MDRIYCDIAMCADVVSSMPTWPADPVEGNKKSRATHSREDFLGKNDKKEEEDGLAKRGRRRRSEDEADDLS